MNKPNTLTYLAVDPLAMLLPPAIYQKLIEKWHPHEPLLAALERALATMSVKEKADTLNRAKQVKEYAEAIEKAVGQVAH